MYDPDDLTTHAVAVGMTGSGKTGLCIDLLEEAALQGICEIVERHVCALVTHEQIYTPAIVPESVSDPVARDLLEIFKANNIELYLNDLG